MDKIQTAIVDRLVTELNFERLNWHGLAEKKIFNKNVGCGFYFIHINAGCDREKGVFIPEKVEVCVWANVSDDDFYAVSVMDTNKVEDIIDLIAKIEKDHRYLYQLFEEGRGQ